MTSRSLASSCIGSSIQRTDTFQEADGKNPACLVSNKHILTQSWTPSVLARHSSRRQRASVRFLSRLLSLCRPAESPNRFQTRTGRSFEFFAPTVITSDASFWCDLQHRWMHRCCCCQFPCSPQTAFSPRQRRTNQMLKMPAHRRPGRRESAVVLNGPRSRGCTVINDNERSTSTCSHSDRMRNPSVQPNQPLTQHPAGVSGLQCRARRLRPVCFLSPMFSAGARWE
jgi:hypothetical protein